MQQRHKVSRTRRKAVFAVVGLVLGGGGLVAVNAGANASDSGKQQASTGAVACPAVEGRLTNVPAGARAEVDRSLELMRQQVREADARMPSVKGGTAEVSNIVLGPLASKRAAVLERIEIAVERTGAERPRDLQSLAVCRVAGQAGAPAAAEDGGEQGAGESQSQGGQEQGGQEQGDGGQDGTGQDGQDQGSRQERQDGGQDGGNGPVPEDFVDITTVAPNVERPRRNQDASNGSFQSRCGVNEQGQFNSDNVIVAPGVDNGAHHTHDYVGAEGVDAFTTDESLAVSRTTCTNGDQSTYYWPVLRDRDGVQESDAAQPGGGADGNVGRILTPATVQLKFVGSPRTKVEAMPRFLRIITGDARANANGGANANARWSCTGFESRVELTDKYPICPQGSKVVRIAKFQSCWDGRNTDSANHRDHVAFADRQGNCPDGFRAVPQLVQRVTYNGLAGSTSFALDSFPEAFHKPVTDHGDFINAMSDELMEKAVNCINTGRRCG
ncbi:DUF1996 domain-containing protein [Streptomyces sp. 549]|uniref:DUF1996 domain-containing protein n=1 Tax=Streptomyces sp. 549 TaxID=3049076 RepID=UPI0024C4303C|nr:DUF1996 domain-containing protein [Streptomyces sp. 549]MDK1471904.1 DUF1996 domain-containing protein [Streptomyces sp. 549]